MALIWNETALFREVLQGAYPEPRSTQADYRNRIRKVLGTVTGDRVTITFEPEGVILKTEDLMVHVLHYPIKPQHFFTAVNLLELKARDRGRSIDE